MFDPSPFVLPLQLVETLRICAPTVVEAALGRHQRARTDRRLNEWANRALRLANSEVVAHGLEENVDPHTSYLLMSNHQSAYDIWALFVAYPHTMRMVAKRGTFRLPIMGNAMRIAGFVEIDRSDHERALAALENAKEAMRSGIHIWIAPEGTRSEDGRLLPFKSGGFLMALQMGCPILPISIEGTREILPSRDYRVRKNKTVHITFHPPVDPNDYGLDRRALLMEKVRDTIASVLPY